VQKKTVSIAEERSRSAKRRTPISSRGGKNRYAARNRNQSKTESLQGRKSCAGRESLAEEVGRLLPDEDVRLGGKKDSSSFCEKALEGGKGRPRPKHTFANSRPVKRRTSRKQGNGEAAEVKGSSKKSPSTKGSYNTRAMAVKKSGKEDKGEKAISNGDASPPLSPTADTFQTAEMTDWEAQKCRTRVWEREGP